MRRYWKVIPCIILIIVAIIFFLEKTNNFEYKLIKIGYTKQEAKEVSQVVPTSAEELILKQTQKDTVINMVTNKQFKAKNLKDYLDYYEKNPKAPIDDVITIVNSGYDIKDRKYSSLLVNLITQKYFIYNNLNRYMKMSKTESNIEKVIKLVNSNADKTKYEDTTEADGKDGNLILVNKYYYLTEDYTPTDLVTLSSDYNTGKNSKMRRDAANAFMKMSNAATLDNVIIKNASAYRSYQYQVNLYNQYVERDGKDAADTYSARAGFSEHQTGLSSDINEISNDFENTDAFTWLNKNAYKYGFILRFPKDKEDLTGYSYESWHWRYVGKKAAKIIKEEDLTLEEYYAYYVLPEKNTN